MAATAVFTRVSAVDNFVAVFTSVHTRYSRSTLSTMPFGRYKSGQRSPPMKVARLYTSRSHTFDFTPMPQARSSHRRRVHDAGRIAARNGYHVA